MNPLTTDVQNSIGSKLSRWFASDEVSSVEPAFPSRFLTLDWTGNQLVLSHVRKQGEALEVLSSFKSTFALASGEEASKAADWLRQTLAQNKIATRDVFVAAPRRFVAFKLLAMPNLDDQRLAAAVYLQAETLFPMSVQDLALDFIAQPFEPNASQRFVLVAAMPKLQVTTIENCLLQADLVLRALIVSELGSVALADQGLPNSSQVIISISSSKMEYVVTSAGRPILSFAAKVPENEGLVPEVLNTLHRLFASLPEGIRPKSIERITLLGQAPAHLASELTKRMGCRVSSSEVTENDERFKVRALVGSGSERVRIDFANSRRAIDPRQQVRRQRVKQAAAAAAIVVALWGGWHLNEARLDSRIKFLQAEQRRLQNHLEEQTPRWQSVAFVSDWQQSQTRWSQSLLQTLKVLPKTEDVIVTRIDMANALSSEATIEIEGHARNTECVNQMIDQFLATPQFEHTQLKRMELRSGDAKYTANFQLSVGLASSH